MLARKSSFALLLVVLMGERLEYSHSENTRGQETTGKATNILEKVSGKRNLSPCT